MMTSNQPPPRVSVIIPTFERREFLLEAVESVLLQSYRDFELIVVDDGSTDGSGDAVTERFDDTRLRVVTQENLGVSAARNRGVRESGGELLSFLDSDDYWKGEKLSRQIEAMEGKEGTVASYTGEEWIRRGKWANPCNHHAKHSGMIFDKCLPLCIISPSSVMMKRDVFLELGGFDETLPACEDYDLWLRLTARYPVLFVEDKLIVKRNGHEGQLSAAFFGLDRFRVAALWKVALDEGISPEKRIKALRWAAKKSKVVANGAKKRGHLSRAATFEYSLKEAKRCLLKLEG